MFLHLSFNISINEPEQIVDEIDLTAEFNKTTSSEEFRQSISATVNYTSDYHADILPLSS